MKTNLLYNSGGGTEPLYLIAKLRISKNLHATHRDLRIACCSGAFIASRAQEICRHQKSKTITAGLLNSGLAVLAVALVLASGPAHAQDNTWGFTMPSGNIMCNLTPGEGGFQSQVRCDLQQLSSRPPAPPADCAADWGDAFAVQTKSTIGERICHAAGDEAQVPRGPVLAYGATWKGEGFTCTSQTTGVTCTNALGHGFAVSREAQRLF